MLPYKDAIERLGEMSPGVDNPTKLFEWAHIVVDVLSVAYHNTDYDQLLTDLIDSVKDYEEYED